MEPHCESAVQATQAPPLQYGFVPEQAVVVEVVVQLLLLQTGVNATTLLPEQLVLPPLQCESAVHCLQTPLTQYGVLPEHELVLVYL